MKLDLDSIAIITIIISFLCLIVICFYSKMNKNIWEIKDKERIQLIFDTTPDVVTICSLQSDLIVGVNDKFVLLTGFSKEDAIGKTTLSLGLWDNLEDRKSLVAELQKNSQYENYEVVLRKKDRSLFTALISAKLMNLNGLPHVISVTRDISERKQAEELLKKYRVLAENIKDVIWVLDAESLRFNYVSPSVFSLTGYTPEEMMSQPFNRILIPESAEYIKGLILQKIEEIISGKLDFSKHYTEEVEHPCKDGTTVWTEAITIFYRNEESDRIEIRGVTRDISERKMAEQKLKQSEEKYRVLIENASESIVVVQEGKLKFCNPMATVLTGYSIDELTAVPFELLIHPDDRELVVMHHKKRLRVEFTEAIYSFRVLKKDNTFSWVEINSVLIEWGGKPATLNFLTDITERKKSKEELLYLSYHDQLTGLYNRRFYEEELKRLDTKRNLPLTIVMADVNGLKLINDSLGHFKGDELLKKVAEVITNGCRADDVIARLGGDEYVILLPNTDSFQTEQIIKRIKGLASIDQIGCCIDISVTFGYDTKNNEKENIQEIIRKAEDHMYKKKLFNSPSMRGKTIKAIINTLHEKNKREEQHSHRVSVLCESMGEALGLPDQEIEVLKTVGLLHDIGKIAIDETVLNKPGKLNDEEWKEIKRHPEIGYRILNTVNDMSDMANYVLYHHERWNGTGYPKGLKGDEIPFVSRIIAIVDAYDAMTSERSYRNALTEEITIAELQKNAGIQFDPELVRVFIEKVLGKSKDIGSIEP